MATARAWGLRGSEWRTQPRSRPACPASKNKRNKVSSTPEVSGTRHKPGPDASGFSIAIDLGTRLHRSWVPASKRKGCPALLGKTSVSPRSTGLGQLFLPVRAQRPGRSGIRRSVGAAPSRNGERSWADREHARPVPGRMKARHLPKCNGATSKLCIALLALASLRFARLASLALASANLANRAPEVASSIFDALSAMRASSMQLASAQPAKSRLLSLMSQRPFRARNRLGNCLNALDLRQQIVVKESKKNKKASTS